VMHRGMRQRLSLLMLEDALGEEHDVR